MLKHVTRRILFYKKQTPQQQQQQQDNDSPSTPTATSKTSETFSSQESGHPTPAALETQRQYNKRCNSRERKTQYDRFSRQYQQTNHQYGQPINAVQPNQQENHQPPPPFHCRKSSLPPPEIQLESQKHFLSSGSTSQHSHRSLSIECINKRDNKHPSLPLDFKENQSAFSIVQHQQQQPKIKRENQRLIKDQFSATQQAKEQQQNLSLNKNTFFNNNQKSKVIQCSKPTLHMPLAMKPMSPYLLARKYFFPVLNPNFLMLNHCNNMISNSGGGMCGGDQGITPMGQEDQETPGQCSQQDNIYFENTQNKFRFRLGLNNCSEGGSSTSQNFYDYESLGSMHCESNLQRLDQAEPKQNEIKKATPEQRRQKIQKYKEKQRRFLERGKKNVIYTCRQKLANDRIRYQGRFVKPQQLEELMAQKQKKEQFFSQKPAPIFKTVRDTSRRQQIRRERNYLKSLKQENESISIMMDSDYSQGVLQSTISGCVKQEQLFRPRVDSIESTLQAGFGEEQQTIFGDSKDIQMADVENYNLFSIAEEEQQQNDEDESGLAINRRMCNDDVQMQKQYQSYLQ